jgi:hypothetical protein
VKLDLDCDWRNALSLTPGSAPTVGYLLFWSGLGGLSLAKDIEVMNPFDGAGQTIVTGKTINCIGLLESFKFEGDSEDPIQLVAYVSKESAANLKSKLSRPVTTTKVQVGVYVIAFDDDKNQWFEALCLRTPDKLSANLDTARGELQIYVGDKGTKLDPQVDLKLVKFTFQIIPAAQSTATIEFATGPTERIMKTWGASS